MADILTSLRVLPYLGQTPGEGDGIRTWFTEGTYNVNPASNNHKIILENINLQQITKYISYDFERFSLCSWESFYVSQLESQEHNLIGWPLLKLYYSGFFSAHAIMRCTGEGIVKLDRTHTQFITDMVNITTGGNGNISPGMFSYRLEQPPNGQLTLTLSPHSGGSGVHDSFWKAFADYLDRNAAFAVSRALPDATLFVAGVDEIAPFIKRDPLRGSSWYSSLRNDINYQHKYGVWYPVKNSGTLNTTICSINRLASNAIRLDLSKENNPIEAFIGISRYFSCLNWELSEFVAARSTAPRTFGAKWRQYQAVLG